MIVDLASAPASDIAFDDGGAIPVFRTEGPAPLLALSPAGGGELSLAPGGYAFAFEARVISGAVGQPILICAGRDGRALEFPLRLDSPFRWSAELQLRQPVTGLQVRFGAGACSFLPTRIRIDDGETEKPPPTLSGAALMASRALFRRAPHFLRAAILNRRALVERMAPMVSAAPDKEGAGRIVLNAAGGDAELDARRADFEQRFAIARGARDPAYVEAGGELGTPPPVLLAAFYLPQFHAIPENDAWWGPGFTEWSNVAKAAPQFVGHDQPRLPGELGFYDLRIPGMMKRQAELARAYGVSAFCFHYYWFGGKRLLEAPVEAFLADRSIDIRFTLCWANENWARTWDGAPDRVLIAQQHSPEDHAAVFDDMARQLEDERALRIGGNPVLMVYRPGVIPSPRVMTEIWRERAHKRGWPGLFLIAANAFGYDAHAEDGFDALSEFPPHGVAADRIEPSLAWLNPRHDGAVFDYASLAERQARRLERARLRHGNTVFPGVMPGWDNEARRPGAGAVYHGAEPHAYAQWLAAAVGYAVRELPADRRIVFLNAWNEWAEGAYLEPDRRFGRAYLAATAQVLRAAAAGAPA